MDIVRETKLMSQRKYLTAYISNDGTISVMGNNKGLAYAIDVVNTHNKYNDHPDLGSWYVIEIGKKVYPNGT